MLLPKYIASGAIPLCHKMFFLFSLYLPMFRKTNYQKTSDKNDKLSIRDSDDNMGGG
jgi:hypothetical protein